MKQLIIGITCSQRPDGQDHLPMAYIPSGYPNGVYRAGGLPFLLPIGNIDRQRIAATVAVLDKLLLTGGQDITPSLYGQANRSGGHDFCPERDAYEMALLEEAIKQGKPILAVCRGMQLYNVFRGGKLHQDIAKHATRQLKHPLVIQGDDVLERIYGKDLQVNSYHHQSLSDLGEDLQVVALDPRDQTVEAIRDRAYPAFLGVQWHPDVQPEVHSESQALFDYFVNEL